MFRYQLESSKEIKKLPDAKNETAIAVLDDDPFKPSKSLTTHGFRIEELGPDIRSLSQISNYPVIICDIRGVAPEFGSSLEGAHLIEQIRKTYPDKFLIAYTGMQHSISHNKALSYADRHMDKAALIEEWVSELDDAVMVMSTPYKRWLRLRLTLDKSGIDAYKIYRLEQTFLKAYIKKNPKLLDTTSIDLTPEIKDLFTLTAKTILMSFFNS